MCLFLQVNGLGHTLGDAYLHNLVWSLCLRAMCMFNLKTYFVWESRPTMYFILKSFHEKSWIILLALFSCFYVCSSVQLGGKVKACLHETQILCRTT
jgi:hypothetical protein